MSEEIIKGSVEDLIFRVETLSSDADTIKVCVRAGKEISALRSKLARVEELEKKWRLLGHKERWDASLPTGTHDPLYKACADELAKALRD